MNSESRMCNCTNEEFALDCPQVFFQDGNPLHVLNPNQQTKPRLYRPLNAENSNAASQQNQQTPTHNGDEFYVPPLSGDGKTSDKAMHDLRIAMQKQIMGGDSSSSSSADDCGIEKEYKVAPRHFTRENQMIPAVQRHGRGQLADDSAMMEQNRKILRKFESLKIGSESLTSMAIGGYAIDITMAAEKAREVAPLPPSKLPIIFKEDDMNFYHHFFQGMEILMGSDTLNEIVETTHFFKKTELLLFPLIEEMIMSGYKRTDNEITIFTKKVLTSTFNLDPANEHNKENKSLIVAANLWGLQYIEPGLEMREADLKMWLSVNHGHYKTLWFNSFKAAGVPSFALGGVQTRYEGPDKSQAEAPIEYSADPMTAVAQATAGIINEHLKDAKHKRSDGKSSRHAKSRRAHRSPESVMGSIFGDRR